VSKSAHNLNAYLKAFKSLSDDLNSQKRFDLGKKNEENTIKIQVK
jgi:hypothetical protein